MALDFTTSIPAAIGSGEIATNIEVDTSIATATTGMVTDATLPASFATNVTTIDGGKITTGTLLSNSIGTEVMYDSTHWVGGVEQGPTVYKMKIDLDNGFIHIK